MLKSITVNKNFQTWHLIGWHTNHQPIRSHVDDWLVANRLSLNVNKTKYMTFHNSQKDISNVSLNLNLNHGKIEKVSTFNFLGIILDENIHWKPHIENVACKQAKYCCVLSKLKNFLSLHILRTLYYSIIHPHLNYGLLVWGFQCNRIAKLQKRAIRTITRSKYNAHTSPLLKQMEILSVNDMLHQKALAFYYKYGNKNLPYHFNSFDITTQGSLHNYNTRQRNNEQDSNQNDWQVPKKWFTRAIKLCPTYRLKLDIHTAYTGYRLQLNDLL